EILLRRNNQKLYRVLRGYLTDHDEVVDVMQDTYVTAYEKLDQFRQSAQFSTWLIRIGINKALKRIYQSRKVVSIHEVKESQFQSNQQPELKYMQTEAKQTLEMAIGSLAEKYRSAYIMKEVEGMSIAEISDCLEITESNVKVRIHRAK
ncbi:MAG: sigma-70 family RNA polymerase sigma factor, partial [Ekhidna sp.]